MVGRREYTERGIAGRSRSQRRTAAIWLEIDARASVDPLVRCDAAKGFACLSQLGKPTGRGKLSGDPLW
jgi:hypothetical protein